MAKALGLNTIATYVFWNHHETSEGEFDCSTGNRDIVRFMRMVAEEGMWVLLRPGPYVCAEWDFGGLPAYLLRDPELRIRSMYPRYIEASDRAPDSRHAAPSATARVLSLAHAALRSHTIRCDVVSRTRSFTIRRSDHMAQTKATARKLATKAE